MRVVVGERHDAEPYAARDVPREVGGRRGHEPACEKPKLREQQARRRHLEDGDGAALERPGMEGDEQRGRDERRARDAERFAQGVEGVAADEQLLEGGVGEARCDPEGEVGHRGRRAEREVAREPVRPERAAEPKEAEGRPEPRGREGPARGAPAGAVGRRRAKSAVGTATDASESASRARRIDAGAVESDPVIAGWRSAVASARAAIQIAIKAAA